MKVKKMIPGNKFFWIVVLVAVDQGIKIFIANFMIDLEFIIIPTVFAFHPHQNINLGWIWNMLDFMMPLSIAVIISLIATIVIIIFYRYGSFHCNRIERGKMLPEIFFPFAMAGAICKLIDDIFWGGSLDYIRLFNWFIFDLKDVYLTVVALPIGTLILLAQEIHMRKLPKNERKVEQEKYKILPWLKKGLPMKPE